MPQLQSLWSEVQRIPGDAIVFLAINVGDTAQVIQDYWNASKFTLPVMMQEKGEVSAAFGVRAYPTNYLVGPDGKVRWRGVGFDEAVLREHLGLVP